jgi:hypothetical protein
MARHQSRHTLRPGDTSRRSRSRLLIKLGLQCGFDRGHVQLVLRPADHQLRCQVGVWDHVAFGLLQADAAVGGAGVGAIVGGKGPVDGVDDAVSRVALKVGDSPGVGGGHGGVVVVGSGVDLSAWLQATREGDYWIYYAAKPTKET